MYKDNWTALADREMVKFQEELFTAVKSKPKMEKYSLNLKEVGGKMQATKSEVFNDFEAAEAAEDEWTFSSCFLYSLSLITTVGKQSSN